MREGRIEWVMVVEMKGYRVCGLCEGIQLALYVVTLAIKLDTTKICGLLICNGKVGIVTFEDILKPKLYEELSKILSVSIA